ncbi:MAG: type II secretion system inner membrane protein GspF [bacterium]
MPVFAYKGYTSRDKKMRSGLIDAESAKVARQKLRKRDIYPIELAQTVEKAREAKSSKSLFSMRTRVSPMDLSAMTRQLATMISADLPLVQSLSALTEQVGNQRLSRVLAEVRESVNEGASLGEAMEAYPRIFSELYVNMVKAGEQSGALDIVLQRLAEFTESQADLRSKIKSASIYPVMVLTIMLLVLVGMFIFVIPKISSLFEQTNQALPLLTKIMIGTSQFIAGWGGLLLLFALAGAAVFFRYRIRTPQGRQRWDKFKLRLPVIGGLIRKISISRFCRTLSTLLSSGIPLLKSLNIVEKVVGNRVLGDAIHNAHENITEGASIAEPLKASQVFPPFVIQMIASGEQSGELEFMLQKAADAFDREVENSIAGITSLIEPMMILVLAGMVVIVILSFLMPILNLTSGIG